MSSRLIYAYVIGLLALALLFFLAVPYYSKSIPTNIEKDARDQLASVGANWATVKGVNRDLFLSGKAPTPKDHQVAINSLDQVSAVRNIYDETTQNLVSPYVMSMEWQNEKLVINGVIPDEESQQKITSILTKEFGGKNISQQIKIAQGQPERWTELVSTLLSHTAPLDRADFHLIDRDLGLSAQTEKTTDKNRLMESLKPFQDFGYNIKAHVIAEDTTKIRCQNQFDNLLTKSQILFASGKETINKASYELLRQLGQIAQSCPDYFLNIAGHTDSQGGKEANLLLSLKRAQSVAKWLVQWGVEEQRIETVGYGSEHPIADNSLVSGRAKNRRIEFIVRSN